MSKKKSARIHLIDLSAPLASAVLALLASAGCQQEPDAPGYIGNKTVGAEIYPSTDEDAHSVNRFVAAQSANAARLDATLRPYHFQGPELNSLGRQKLDLMAHADRGDLPMTVYLDIPEDADQGVRRDSVVVYLKDSGLRDEQIKIQAGPNLDPDNLHPTAQAIKMTHMLDAGAPVAQNPEPAGAVPLSPATASPSGGGH